MPFAADLLSPYGYLPLAVGSYAVAAAAIGLVMSAIWIYASHAHRLVDRDLDAGFIRQRTVVMLAGPGIFLISIPFAWLNPIASMVVWWVAPIISLAARRPGRLAQSV